MNFSRFDSIVWTVAALLIGLTGVVIFMGNQVEGQSLTHHPRILFIRPDENGPEQIYLAELDGQSEPVQLTQSATTILGFAVSPDSSQIIFASFSEVDVQTAYADLWLMDADGTNAQMVLPCPDATCSNPVWMPDGRRIIYERRNITSPSAPPGNPRLWWFDISTGETLPIFADSQQLGLFPSISPDETWLSFVSPADQGIQLFNLNTGTGMLIPNQMGTGVSWSADSQTIALSDIATQDGVWSMNISKLNVYTEEVSPLNNQQDSDDNNPVYSTDGQRIAFGHKESQTAMGRQIWLMEADGTAVTPLTNTPDIHHTQFLWSPDNSKLLTQQYNIKELFTKPGVWVIDVNTGEATEIAYPATQPAWLP